MLREKTGRNKTNCILKEKKKESKKRIKKKKKMQYEQNQGIENIFLVAITVKIFNTTCVLWTF